MWIVWEFLKGGVARLWRIADFWRVSPLEGVRTGSPLAGGLLFLFLLFFCVGAILVALGFNFDDVDRWLDAQAGWLDLVGSVIFRVILVVIAIVCAVAIWALLFDRKAPDTPGWMATVAIILGCLLLGYCSAVNIAAPL